jgi:hypothetical protein
VFKIKPDEIIQPPKKGYRNINKNCKKRCSCDYLKLATYYKVRISSFVILIFLCGLGLHETSRGGGKVGDEL